MRGNIVSKIIVPLLFLLISTLCALIAVDHATLPQSIVYQPEPQTEPIEEVESTPSNLISEYDHIFKEVGEQYDIDWLLLAAIAHTESKFRADAKSPMGARGLMQIMPHVARQMGYTREQLLDARTNVEIGALLLLENQKMLHLPKDFDKEEGLKFTLACYNAGYSRIDDARDLANYFDAKADNWESVGLFLSWLSDPDFFELEVVESGPFYGSKETLDYVDRVTKTYTNYRELHQTKSEVPEDTSLK